MPSIKKSKADISFIIGIRNNVSTYQALECLINTNVSVFVFDTARVESIFHAKVVAGSGLTTAKLYAVVQISLQVVWLIILRQELLVN